MRSPDIEPARLERLLAGFAPETAQEAILQGLVRELRGGMPEAPLALRERVRMICEPVSRPRVVVTRRRLAVVLAAALVALAGGIFASTRGSSERASAELTSEVRSAEPEELVGGARFDLAPPSTFSSAVGALLRKDWSAAGTDHTAADALTAQAAGIDGRRAQDVDLSMTIRVADADALSDATNDALALTKRLGGFVRSSNVGTQDKEGEARLALAIPVRKLEDAVVGLSALGTITQQKVVTADLQGGIDRRSTRIAALRRAIASDELRLASGTLTAEEKLQVELRLVRERAEVRRVRRERAAIRRQASMAELTLALNTRAGAPAAKHDEGRLLGAVRDGAAYLAAGGAVAIVVAIVASPFVLLGALLWLALRTRRRRIDEHLLAEPRPAAAPHAAPPPTE